jgi:IS5 family transposase
MRGMDEMQETLFTTVKLEDFVPADHPLRPIRVLMEQMRYNLLFRWFVGLAIEDAVWDHAVFSKNRDWLLEHEVVEAFFTEVMSLGDKRGLLSSDHFSVDGTLIQARARHKSFRRKDGADDGSPAGGGRNADTDWKGERRSNATHESTTDVEARLVKKSHNSPAILCSTGTS